MQLATGIDENDKYGTDTNGFESPVNIPFQAGLINWVLNGQFHVRGLIVH